MNPPVSETPAETKRLLLPTAIVIAIVAILGAGAWLVLNRDYVQFRLLCAEYRRPGSWCARVKWWHTAAGPLQAISWNRHFMKNCVGMKESEISRLLGPPRIETDRSRDGYINVRGWLEDLGLEWNGSERVLLYNSNGPPHSIGDETENLFFLVRDGKVIAWRGLFP